MWKVWGYVLWRVVFCIVRFYDYNDKVELFFFIMWCCSTNWRYMNKGLLFMDWEQTFLRLEIRAFVVCCCYYLYSLWKRKFKSRQGRTQICPDENLFEHTIGRWDPKNDLSREPYLFFTSYSTMNYLTELFKIYGVLSQSLTEREHICQLTQIRLCTYARNAIFAQL